MKTETCHEKIAIPETKVSLVVGTHIASPKTRKHLFLGVALQKQIPSQKPDMVKSKKQSQLMHKVIRNTILTKY